LIRLIEIIETTTTRPDGVEDLVSESVQITEFASCEEANASLRKRQELFNGQPGELLERPLRG
jgi:hypothetical protein